MAIISHRRQTAVYIHLDYTLTRLFVHLKGLHNTGYQNRQVNFVLCVLLGPRIVQDVIDQLLHSHNFPFDDIDQGLVFFAEIWIGFDNLECAGERPKGISNFMGDAGRQREEALAGEGVPYPAGRGIEQDQTDPEVEAILRDLVRAIIGAQDEQTGRWQTAMSHPDETGNYLETSATALFAYGIARAYRVGIFGDAERLVAINAVEGVKQMVVDDGDGPVVTGVSTATDPWPLRSPTGGEDGYLDVPVEDDVNYGVGAVILALIETSGLPE